MACAMAGLRTVEVNSGYSGNIGPSSMEGSGAPVAPLIAVLCRHVHGMEIAAGMSEDMEIIRRQQPRDESFIADGKIITGLIQHRSLRSSCGPAYAWCPWPGGPTP